MSVSLNSVVGFNAKLQAKYQHVSRSSVGASAQKAVQFISYSRMFSSSIPLRGRRWSFCLPVADNDLLATDTSDTDSGQAESLVSDVKSSAIKPSSLDSPVGSSKFQASIDDQSGLQTPSNGPMASSDTKQVTAASPNLQSTPKRSSLTARERLRAARVLNRYTESKESKPEMGSKVLDALRESDRGKKRSRLPEAPTNLFDDSKRGMPKKGLTFEFPGGNDLFVIAFSFVFISTVMFATTYIVWKVGAIHFNEY